MTNSTATKPASTIPADDLTRELTLAGPNEDAKLQHVALAGDIYTMVLTGADTANKFCLIDMQIPPGGGPAPHRHDFEETFTLLEGELDATFRGKKQVVKAGETVHIPANAPHQFHNSSASPVRLLCTCSPAGQENFFRDIGVAVATRTTPPPIPDEAAQAQFKAKAARLAPLYKTEFLKEA